MFDVNNVSLVIADIDGTICDDNKKISDRTIDVIKRLKAHGVGFGLASGRNTSDLNKFAYVWGLDGGFEVLIGLNGSELYDGFTGKNELFNTLTKEQIKEIVLMMEPLDLNPNLIIDQDHHLVKRIDERVKASLQRINRDIKVAHDISDFWKEDALKIMFRCPVERMPEVKKWVLAHPNPLYNGFQTDPGNYEFAPGNIDKGYAFKVFCDRHHVDSNTVMYFGDMMNDVPMFKACGLGVAMKNASDEALSACDDVTELTNNEDGFAYYIEKHILEPRGW